MSVGTCLPKMKNEGNRTRLETSTTIRGDVVKLTECLIMVFRPEREVPAAVPVARLVPLRPAIYVLWARSSVAQVCRAVEELPAGVFQ